jgi:hypothetical protein
LGYIPFWNKVHHWLHYSPPEIEDFFEKNTGNIPSFLENNTIFRYFLIGLVLKGDSKVLVTGRKSPSSPYHKPEKHSELLV